MKILRFFEKLLPLFFWLLLIFAFDSPLFGTLTLIAALIHETGHLVPLFLWQTGGKLRALTDGLRIGIVATLSYKKEFAIVAAGPLFNIFAALLALPFSENGYFLLFFAINLMTAISNLLPLEGHDGYRIAVTIANILPRYSDTLLGIISLSSKLVSVLLLFLSLYLMLKVGEGYWIFAVFFTSFMSLASKAVKRDVF